MKHTIPWDAIIARIQNRETKSEKKLLEEWLADEENSDLYQHLSGLYFNIQQQSVEYDPDVEYYWKEMQARMHLKPAIKNTRTWNIKYAAVAAILVGVISVFSTYFITHYQVDSLPAISQSYESLNGKSKIVLPDSSVVWLNSKSVLCYESNLGNKERRVSLKGEALFDVVKDVDREFVVDAGGISVHVHGTQFSVEARNGSDEVSVALIHGSVSLETAQTHMYIVPGEKAFYSRSKGRIQLSKVDTDIETLWAASQIRLENKSLTELSRYFEKWYGVRMVISPEISQKQAYSFTITNESLEEILRLMMRIHPISYHFGEDDTLFINPL